MVLRWYQQLGKKNSHFSTKLATENGKNTFGLRNEIIIEELKISHNKTLVDPIDKTSGNVIFVYPNHCTNALINAFALNNADNIPLTYTKTIKSNNT